MRLLRTAKPATKNAGDFATPDNAVDEQDEKYENTEKFIPKYGKRCVNRHPGKDWIRLMLRAYNAFTHEAHQAQRAARDILAQVETFPLEENSLGLVVCEQIFIENGTLAALTALLPFPCVGINTTHSGVQGAADVHLLSLMVLTADDIFFETAVSESITDLARENPANPFRNIRLGAPPALILAFAPMLFEYGIDEKTFLGMLRETTGDIPVFGSLAVNYFDGDYVGSRVIHNRQTYRDRSVLVLIRGPLEPRFALGSIPPGCVIEQEAVITKARNATLMEINNRPVLEFLREHGLFFGEKLTGAHAYPFSIDPGHGKPAFNTTSYGMTPEGYLLCGKILPVGGVVSLIAQDFGSVMKTANEVVRAVKDSGPARAVLMFSCHGRSLNLGFEDMAELELVQDSFPGAPPFIIAYSGGEIFPVEDKAGQRVSKLLTHTLIACVL